ncbi:hypothetical protein YTPLAS18_20560 [Nitrospira sp.]|nr:hypothetical protein YTPLAS18_20560 [Nitrospira sp.]
MTKFMSTCAFLLCSIFSIIATTEAASKIKIIYGEARSGSLRQQKETAQRLRLLEFAEAYSSFSLPSKLTVTAEECDHANAYYNSVTRTVTICYELMRHLEQVAFKDYPRPRERAQAEMVIEGALKFILAHEVSHALIDVLQLRFTGREEDVADQIATIGAIASGVSTSFLAGALWFFDTANTDLSEQAFADEHSFQKQRLYNVMCWAYGKDEQKYKHLESSLGSRATHCHGEYEIMREGIGSLLGPHVDLNALNELRRQGGLPPLQPSAQRFTLP